LERANLDRPANVRIYLDFEKPIAELEGKVAELKSLEGDESVSIMDEIKKLEQKARAALVDTYAKLTPWQKTQVARHPERPHAFDYIASLIEEFDYPALGPGQMYEALADRCRQAGVSTSVITGRRKRSAMCIRRTALR
jgi:acetyl-CoA carboxylase alpha subunit